MIEKIRQRLLNFINSDKDTPLLAGFSVGFYMILFYYARNFSLANSWQQLFFFVGFYIGMPMLLIYIGYKILPLLKLGGYRKQFLFVATTGLLAFFLVLLNTGIVSKIAAVGIGVFIIIISFWLKTYYKLVIVLLFLLSVFNMPNLVEILWISAHASSDWKKQPDDIENVAFKERPNIYYIQPDGYTSFDNLKNSIHRFDNSDYEQFLQASGFTLYPDYRCNYYSTLLSNSATFSMKHHYVEPDVEMYKARDIIISDNPVLRILKKNGYRTFFITENPYLVINRPDLGYDYCNIDYSEIPYLKDGFGIVKDVMGDLKSQMKPNTSGNFFFIEKFTPKHIAIYAAVSKGAEEEKNIYLGAVKKANVWLKDIITYIEKNDPNALIIIGADHGGFVGFNHTHESMVKTDKPELINSIFGAQLAIKWNGKRPNEYDANLKTGVNLFRTVFSYLGKDKKYLNHFQENGSYMLLTQPDGVYRYIDDKGNFVFQPKK